MRILIINGPNINMLGIREPEVYGNRTYQDLIHYIEGAAQALDVEVDFFQSNHEGALVDQIQEEEIRPGLRQDAEKWEADQVRQVTAAIRAVTDAMWAVYG